MKKFDTMLLVVVLLLVGVLVLPGCKKESEPAPAEETVSAQILQKTCPVMEGNPINKKLFIEHKGKKVYFCCPGCEPKFKADPEKYIAKLPQFKN